MKKWWPVELKFLNSPVLKSKKTTKAPSSKFKMIPSETTRMSSGIFSLLLTIMIFCLIISLVEPTLPTVRNT